MTTLTDYEARQVREIALWKSERPSLLLESYRGLTRPISKLIAHVIPKGLARKALGKVEALAEDHKLADDILKAAGASSVEELLRRPLEECDRLSGMVSTRAEHLALAEGIVPAVGGAVVPGPGDAVASVLDVPFLLEATLRAVRRVGHCYGFPLRSSADRRFVLAILEVANDETTPGLDESRLGLWAPGGPPERMPDGSDPAEGIEEAVVDDLPLEAIPIVGEVSNLVLDRAFVCRADVTARRVFQERWLRENGKVESIRPAVESRRRSSFDGVVGVASDLAYVSSFGVSFGVTFASALVGSIARSIAPEVVLRGVADGATAAERDSRRLLERAGRALEPPPRPALAASPA